MSSSSPTKKRIRITEVEEDDSSFSPHIPRSKEDCSSHPFIQDQLQALQMAKNLLNFVDTTAQPTVSAFLDRWEKCLSSLQHLQAKYQELDHNQSIIQVQLKRAHEKNVNLFHALTKKDETVNQLRNQLEREKEEHRNEMYKLSNSAIQQDKTITILEEQLYQEEQINSQMREDINNIQAEFNKKRDKLVEEMKESKARELHLESSLKDRDSIIDSLEQQLQFKSSLEQEISTLQETICEKDSTIQSLQQEVITEKDNISAAVQQLKDFRANKASEPNQHQCLVMVPIKKPVNQYFTRPIGHISVTHLLEEHQAQQRKLVEVTRCLERSDAQLSQSRAENAELRQQISNPTIDMNTRSEVSNEQRPKAKSTIDEEAWPKRVKALEEVNTEMRSYIDTQRSKYQVIRNDVELENNNLRREIWDLKTVIAKACL
ncbi:uncharacterized protein L201_000155 [Kwoniella dendrophila CBS 6074]|uniref:Uncharacterized protein n=1 Tax=Kwoniella dendrophila CBS 6074 TaxID=1295534 RepID=A0AAX4JK49_9TREE